MASLSAAELFKYRDTEKNRVPIFLKKYKNKEPFVLNNGTKVVLVYQKAVAAVLASRNAQQAAKLLFIGAPTTRNGKPAMYRLADFAKTVDFGGKAATTAAPGAGIGNEMMFIHAINTFIKKAKSDTGVTIVFQGKKRFSVKNVVEAISAGRDTANSKKADAVLVTKGGKHVAISLKQLDAGGWESSDKLFRQLGAKLLKSLLRGKGAELAKKVNKPVMLKQSGETSTINRTVGMTATADEQTAAVFGSDIKKTGGAVIIRTFTPKDFNAAPDKPTTLIITCDYVIQDLADIPPEKTPIWVIRNQAGRASLVDAADTDTKKWRGLRTEMKIRKYASGSNALLLTATDRRAILGSEEVNLQRGV
jgi:hypothetical protein